VIVYREQHLPLWVKIFGGVDADGALRLNHRHALEQIGPLVNAPVFAWALSKGGASSTVCFNRDTGPEVVGDKNCQQDRPYYSARLGGEGAGKSCQER